MQISDSKNAEHEIMGRVYAILLQASQQAAAPEGNEMAQPPPVPHPRQSTNPL